MKALILCAGLGTRLRPITNTTPKPLVPINGVPLLVYHLNALYAYGVREILVNTHYLPEQIEAFVEQLNGQYPGLTITTAYEKELLGSAGTLKANAAFFKDEESFLVVYGDNLTNIDYSLFVESHKRQGGEVTIAVYHELFPETKGIIVLSSEGVIQKFIEKPKADQVVSNLANAGIYVVNSSIFSVLATLQKPVIDFGFDVFPELLAMQKKMCVYNMKETILDIGTLESYALAQDVVKTW